MPDWLDSEGLRIRGWVQNKKLWVHPRLSPQGVPLKEAKRIQKRISLTTMAEYCLTYASEHKSEGPQ